MQTTFNVDEIVPANFDQVLQEFIRRTSTFNGVDVNGPFPEHFIQWVMLNGFTQQSDGFVHAVTQQRFNIRPIGNVSDYQDKFRT